MELLKSLVHGVNTNVLEQLKTIAIVNQQILNGELIVNNNDVVDELLVKNYFHPLENLLNQFISLLEDSKLQDNNNNNLIGKSKFSKIILNLLLCQLLKSLNKIQMTY